MNSNLVATEDIVIDAAPEAVWEVLTNPEKIKIYLFGTKTETDWKTDSVITFSGEYQGQVYTDKGVVLESDPHRLLKYSYWSGFSGLKDDPDNYSMITYTIKELDNGQCKFTWHQQGFSTEEGQCHTQEGLRSMLAQIKEEAEGI